jgi:hypothetical protein
VRSPGRTTNDQTKNQTRVECGSGLEFLHPLGIAPEITPERISENPHYRKLDQNQTPILRVLASA